MESDTGLPDNLTNELSLPHAPGLTPGLSLLAWQRSAWLSVIIVLATAIAGTYLYLQRLYERAELHRDQLLRANLASELATRLETQLEKESDPSLLTYYRVAREFTILFPDVDPYLVDSAGNLVLPLSPTAGPSRINGISIEPIRRFLDTADRLAGPILGDNPPEIYKPTIFSVAPFTSKYLKGYVYVVLDNRSRRLLSISLLERGHWIGFLSLIALLLIAINALRMMLKNVTGKMLGRITRSLHVLAPDLADFQRSEIDSADFAAYERMLTELVGTIAKDRVALIGKDDETQKIISGVSHDFRTPLHLIQQYAARINSDEAISHPQAQRKEIEQIQRNVKSLISLLSQFNDFNHLKSQETALLKQTCQLEELVLELAEVYAVSAKEKGITLLADGPPGLPATQADISLIERVLRNLVDNAIRHTAAGGKVELRVSEHSGMIRMQVSDTGCGIPESELPHIFKPFRQVSKAGRANGSSGLGLAIVDRIVRAHGSKICVNSVEHRGTTFWFDLPVIN